ncbi:MAG: hypothetical protein L0332_29445 [Chloroflexi bacterium]|nr:hypothetical protein [Chloroflexota bacterium]MCI0579547.1 hypothetical protein [Chloroflexota bacterium]MCI0647516.1 hypothetical protein [Chloroflexota bacterium]MCI0730827.1 hypothetical protein [Chloroflexota bacterium]
MFSRRSVRVISLAIALMLLAVSLSGGIAFGHNWSCGSFGWHWNRNGSSVTIGVYNTATYYNEANAARNDWSVNTILYLPNRTSHTDISVFDGNYGNTGWGGLAEIINYSGCHISHGHARLNYYYNYSSADKRGIFCQEIGHLFGLDHSNDGCMGKGYYNNSNVTVQHNWNDIYNKYRYPHSAPQEAGETPVWHAYWHNNPATLAEAQALASDIVVVQVTGVERGPDIVPASSTADRHNDRLPTSRVSLQVSQVLKGNAQGTLELFFTGTDGQYIAGDAPYVAGQSYVLFLQPRGDGTYLTISPLGRYAVEDGKLVPAADWGFAPSLAGQSVDDLAQQLSATD